MVENCDFLKRLRNVHLEKSAVTGLFYPSRSPKTAKTPRKVHLRLRFQNLGKPRTAGLCGRAAGACDCGPLSCAFIERVNKGRKPPKRGMAGRETRIPKGLVPHRRSGIHRGFSYIAHNRRNVRFKGLWRDTHHPIPEPRTQRLTRRNTGRFGRGVVSLPSDRFARFGNPAWPGGRTANFAAFGSWPGVLPKNAESLRNSDALMRVAVPRRRGPAGLRDPVSALLIMW